MNQKDQIGIFGLNYSNNLESFYIKALRDLNYKNIRFLGNNIYFYIFCVFKKFKSHHLFKILEYFQYIKFKKFLKNNNIKVMIIFKGIELSEDIYMLLKKKKIMLINIYTDDPFNFNSEATSSKNIIKNMKYYDVFCIFSKKIKKKLSKKFKKNIFFYLPFAYSDQKHLKSNNSKIIKGKISFVGSYDKERFDLLNKLKEKIDIIGNAWPVFIKHKTHQFITGKKFSRNISESEISLNILKKQNFFSHNMRTFEIPSMGGLMLTTRTSEQNNFFPENKASFMFGSINELNQKITYILKNPKIALKVRKKGYVLSQKHNYKERLKSLINFVKINEKFIHSRQFANKKFN